MLAPMRLLGAGRCSLQHKDTTELFIAHMDSAADESWAWEEPGPHCLLWQGGICSTSSCLQHLERFQIMHIPPPLSHDALHV